MPRSDNECRLIGIEMAHGNVFHSAFLGSLLEVGSTFIVHAMLNDEQRNEHIELGHVAVFEYMNKALSKGINGNPMFVSAQYLTSDDNRKVLDSYNEELARMRKLRDEPIEENAASTTSDGGADGGYRS